MRLLNAIVFVCMSYMIEFIMFLVHYSQSYDIYVTFSKY